MAKHSGLPESFFSTETIDFSKPVELGNVKGKSVIVTGGARGLGEGCVNAFAEAGAYVTILDINEETGKAVADRLKERKFHVQFVKTDTTSFASQTSAFKSAIDFAPTKTIDIVVTSAGLTGNSVQAYVEKFADSDADPEAPDTATIDVNLTGLFYSTHLALHYFKKIAKSGDKASKQLILISSLAGYVPLNSIADYNASKFGVRGFWKAIRHSTNILGADAPPFRTNLIAPTFIRTSMTKTIEENLLKMDIELGEVEDVVAGVMKLATDESIYGRAVAIAARKEVAGDRNWDLGDDWDGLDAGPGVLDKIQDGSIKGLQLVGMGAYGRRDPIKDLRKGLQG